MAKAPMPPAPGQFDMFGFTHSGVPPTALGWSLVTERDGGRYFNYLQPIVGDRYELCVYVYRTGQWQRTHTARGTLDQLEAQYTAHLLTGTWS